jgi:cellulose synthase/poly-beta-1,6-N-acetylglucosamine synthase-like glycosyltransferase
MSFLIAEISLALLLVTWALYPAGIWLLGRLRRPLVPEVPVRPPRVAVVIASRADNEAIEARVQDVLRSDYQRDLVQVVVGVDVSRPDETLPTPTDPRVRIVRGDAPGGKAATLNAAVRHCDSDLLVFTDTAQRLAPDAIAMLAGSLRDPSIGIVSGSLELAPTGKVPVPTALYWRYERWVRRAEARLDSAVGVTGAIYAMRRELWSPLPAGLILDDLYVPMAVVLRGYRVGFSAHAIARDPRPFSPSEEFRRKSRTLTGVVQLCVWMPAVLLPWRNRIWPQFVAHKLLRLVTPYLVVAAVAALSWAAWDGRAVSPAIGWAVAGLAAVGALAVAIRPIRTALSVVILMQAAVVRALFHGARGEWDVWQS